MQVGYFAIGIGLGADPEVVSLTAQTAEQAGFHSLWAPEHVVLLDQYTSKYPYSSDGRLPMPTTQIDILDPFYRADVCRCANDNTPPWNRHLSGARAQPGCHGQRGRQFG